MRYFAWGIASAALAFASPSLATEPAQRGAERLFSDGLKLAHGGDCGRARDKFTESYAADPAPGTLINWALCEERLGRSATALELLRLADQTLPASHPKRGGLVKHIDALTKRAPLLRLRAAAPLPQGVSVMMDGATVESNAFAQGVLGDPGPHVVELRAPGREDRRYEVVLAEATTLEVTVEAGLPRAQRSASALKAVAVAPAESVAVPLAATEEPAPTPTSSTLGWVFAGSGLAMVGAGAVTGLLAKGKWDVAREECNVDRKICPTDVGADAIAAGETLSTVSTVAFIVGGASLAVGGYLLLTKKDAPARARVAASAGPGGFGVHLGGEF
jgi:hypothetical protein